MFYLRFHARPRPAHPDASTVGGAFVGCWIERPTLQEAESVARIWLTSRLWRVDAREEAVPILVEALDFEDPMLREHAAWALGWIGGSPARAALAARRALERDVNVLQAIAHALDDRARTRSDSRT